MTQRMFCKGIWLASICCGLCLAAMADDAASQTPEPQMQSSSGMSKTRRIDSMCGPYCLWQISRAFEKDYSVNAIMKMAATSYAFS